MGTCGCGDFYPEFKFEGPNGTFYALQIYRGCEGCQSPVGMILCRLTRKEMEDLGFDHLPELPFHALTADCSEAFVKVMDPMKVAKALDLDHDRIEVYRALGSV